MAEALVIDATMGLVTEAAKGIISSVISRTAREVRHAWNLEEELKALENKLRRIHILLCNTSDSTSSSNPLLNDWLNKVKIVGYDADDLLDAFTFESLKRRLQIENTSMKAKKIFLRCLANYSIIIPGFPISQRVRGLMDSIEGVFEDARVLGIRPVEMAVCSSSSIFNGVSIADMQLQVRRELVDGRGLIGRDVDEVKIINKLCDSENLSNDLSIVAIVGMAGLGKTALCKRVFDKNQVKNYFQQRIWICVSHDFEVKGILLKMIELVGGQASNASSHQAMLQELEKILRGKRYLLVLDDVWDTISNVWEPLYGALLDVGGLKGTMILATSRSSQVVATMEVYQISAMRKTPFIHQLKGLTYDDSCLLFTQRLDRSINGDSGSKVAARKMVMKCAGVPLAIKSLADLLRSKSLDKWKEIEESEIWKVEDKNGILPSLKLSFNYLPSAAVKICFAYCAIFPEDAVISRQHLIELWMAQGFLQPYDKMEEIGNDYFNLLLNHSFFQDVKFDEHGNVKTFQMHDVVHTLAKVISGQECLIFKESTDIIHDVSTDIRHLSLLSEKVFTLKLKEKLRTLISHSLDIRKPHDLLRHAKCLRVLSLVNAGLKKLPESIGDLKHLRYLDISENYIKVLPNSISRLYNLQTYRHYCIIVWSWSAYPSLPVGLSKFVNLRHIHANEFSCMGFPLRFQLESSKSRPDRGGRKWGTRISDLSSLNELSGSLAIWQLEHVPSREEARKACLRTKTRVHQLDLTWSYGATNLANCEEVLEELQPHMNLKELSLWYYKGKISPSWLTGLSKLEQIKIFYCTHLEQLPTSPVFPFLKVLVVWGCDKLTTFPDPTGLESLEKLQIGRCPMLNNLPSLKPMCNLRMLEIHNCGKMTTFPDGISDLPNLTTLEIGPLCKDLNYFPFAGDLNGESPLSTSLLKLRLTGWPKVKDLPRQIQHLARLKTLSLGYFDSLEALPGWFGSLSCLEALEFQNMVSLKKLPLQLLNITVPSGSIRLPMN